MAKLGLLIEAWDEGQREFEFALEGLADEDLWRRAHPRLLSVGELAGHISYWKARKASGHFPEDSPDRIKSILVDPRFSYYTEEVDQPVELNIGVVELLTEMRRVHEEAKRLIVALDPDDTDRVPGQTRATWGFYVQYTVFHVAYHTGQAYSVRHLLGHTTTDN